MVEADAELLAKGSAVLCFRESVSHTGAGEYVPGGGFEHPECGAASGAIPEIDMADVVELVGGGEVGREAGSVEFGVTVLVLHVVVVEGLGDGGLGYGVGG